MMIKIRRRKKKIILIRDFLVALLFRCLFVEGEGEGRTMELCLFVEVEGRRAVSLCGIGRAVSLCGREKSCVSLWKGEGRRRANQWKS